MIETPAASGADLARMALAAARANAKHTPAPAARKTRRGPRPARGEGRDPQGLSTILDRLQAEQGWDAGLNGGNLLDQWATIAPTELAATVQAVAYDPERGILELRPASPAYATQIRLFQQQLAAHLNRALGRPAVRSIRVLAPGGDHQPTADTPEPETPAVPVGPVKTRDTAHPGYQATLALALEHRGHHERIDPYEEQARARQEAALRAGRQPEGENRDAVWETDRLESARVDQAEAVRQVAIARARHERAEGTEPRRIFGAA
ncbi:DciA family protein [Streptomyces sp. NPDC059712]|uniref:DciA family protein n=1 Tax=Streptomyces sp. NPDC059712 TaxID=3346919 RepID=UPI0036C8B2B6